jgi:dTDP-4-dehydrorhamnose reductase
LYRIRAGGAASASLSGTYHLAAAGETTWHGYARYVIELALREGATLKAGPDALNPIPTEAYPLPAARPRNSRLDTSAFRAAFDLNLPDWRYHVQRLIAELSAQGHL